MEYQTNSTTNSRPKNEREVYAVKDVVVGEFTNLMEFDTKERAIQKFNLDLKRGKESQGLQDKDYQLFKIGKFNNESGEFTPELEFVQQGLPKEAE